jgi:hypothetical protein
MDTGAIFLLLAVMFIAGLFVSRPLLNSRRVRLVSSKEQELSALMAERDRLITTLQELDFDHALGKIPAEDYPAMRSALVQRAADVLRALDTFQASQPAPAAKDRIEDAIAARRADVTQKPVQPGPDALKLDDDVENLIAARKASRKEKSAGFCSKCGKAVLRSDRFCPHCGKPIN